MAGGLLAEIADRKDDEPFWSESLQALVVKWSDTYVVAVLPMIFNNRIVIGRPDEMTFGYHCGWCYDKVLSVKAALEWDPETEDEPAGYIKAIGRRDRRWV